MNWAWSRDDICSSLRGYSSLVFKKLRFSNSLVYVPFCVFHLELSYLATSALLKTGEIQEIIFTAPTLSHSTLVFLRRHKNLQSLVLNLAYFIDKRVAYTLTQGLSSYMYSIHPLDFSFCLSRIPPPSLITYPISPHSMWAWKNCQSWHSTPGQALGMRP